MNVKGCGSGHGLYYGPNIFAREKCRKQQIVLVKVVTSCVKLNTVVHMPNG